MRKKPIIFFISVYDHAGGKQIDSIKITGALPLVKYISSKYLSIDEELLLLFS